LEKRKSRGKRRRRFMENESLRFGAYFFSGFLPKQEKGGK
jgi:hypothetical protein